MGGTWRRIAGYGPFFGYAVFAYGCGSDTQTGQTTPDPEGAGAATTGGAASSGGARGVSGADSGGSTAGDASAGGAPSGGGDAGPPAPALGTCVPKGKLPASCNEVCLDQGKRCSEECDVGSILPVRAVYYRDAQSCEARTNPVFLESARCDARWEPGDFLPWAVVSCCCESSAFVPATADEREPLCTAACATDPYPVVPECEHGGGCHDRCMTSTRGIDAACAECIAGGVSFTRSGCGEWECFCGGASFPSYFSTSPCNEACAATRERERALYAAKPRPESVGRPPASSREIPEDFSIRGLLADEPDRLWAVGHSPSPTGVGVRLSVKLFDASFNVLWEWDDPAARALQGPVLSTRLGGETVVAVQPAYEPDFLLFFDGAGSVREVKSPLAAPSALSALGDGLLLVSRPDVYTTFTSLEVTGAVRFEAPERTLEGFSSPWTHAVHSTPPSWTVVARQEDVLQWRRVAPTGNPLDPVAVLWTHSLVAQSSRSVEGAMAAGDDVVVWGSLTAERENASSGFPWVTRLAADGKAHFEWSNGDLVTPGRVEGAVYTVPGDICTVGEESWEFSRADVPASGPRCSPDGCQALTVRCLDATGTEKWKYHHRSESSVGHAIAATRTGQLFVTATVKRDPLRSTGWRELFYRFDP